MQPNYADDEFELDEFAVAGDGGDYDTGAGVGLYGLRIGLGHVGGDEGR